MEINKVQWRLIAKGEKLPCDSFLMRKDGTITSMVTGAGVTVGQDAYYLPVEELRSFPKEESEDERIRKELIAEIKEKIDCIPVPDCRDKEDEKALKQLNKWLAWLEKQAEQKPDDKVEPKFKVGDYVVGKYISGYISEVRDDCYLLDYQGFPIDKQDNYHLWTIQDAKDGDVLCSGQIIVIFKHFEDPSYKQSIVAYIGLDAIGNVQITDDTWTLGIDKVKPATKEQRDTLLKAMTDAGYTFDFEKKELKKVEQKPWSEEDETVLNNLIYALVNDRIGNNRDEYVDWLKSLRPKNTWKPSEEQISVLEFVMEDIEKDSIRYAVLNSVLEQLKKLREK